MSKRKQSTDEPDSDSDISFIDVDFDFFNPNPSVDYHAIKRLLTQLFQKDADRFHLHDLADLILSQPTIGTTIKTDGEDSDPYALLTVLNMHVHRDHPSIAALANYFLQKSSSDTGLHNTLQTLFSQTTSHVGLVLCERLINMPVQVIPHMYRMLAEELRVALSENSAFAFTHLLIPSRTYHLSLDDEAHLANSQSRNVSSKKKKKKAGRDTLDSVPRPEDGVYSFHPEDECIKEFAQHEINYPFSSQPEPREKDSFGLDTRGRLMLVSADKFEEMVGKMGEVYAVV
ncbi:Mss4p nuclear export [Stygiomarasmius scandens]|uniref:Protein BCP1 n=1 Tax=Marasmiellus scandens TaxID=2682957 RepID=A0ABR1JW73_9AGAR